MSHLFDQYFAKHGHYPRVVVRSGAQRLTVEFARGYVHVETSHPYAGEVFITRSAWFAILRKCIPLTRLWHANPAKDWDVPQRMHKAFLEELRLNEEKRAMKKSRQIDPEAMDQQRRRFLAAKARGAKRRARTGADDGD